MSANDVILYILALQGMPWDKSGVRGKVPMAAFPLIWNFWDFCEALFLLGFLQAYH